MYLIPSFILIPIVIIALYLLNRQNDKKVKESIDEMIEPIHKDALFDTISPPTKDIKHTKTAPLKQTPKLTPAQRAATEEKIRNLKASLKRIQDAKLN